MGVWIDSWHMGDTLMSCLGTATDRSISLRGSYAVTEGPDWGWRIAIDSADDRTFRVVMHNVTPEGHEELAVEAVYTRA